MMFTVLVEPKRRYLNLALSWLYGPEFESVASTCPTRPAGSCGPRVLPGPARACPERTDYRSAVMPRQSILCRPCGDLSSN